MALMRNLIAGLQALFRKQKANSELDEELRDYLDAATAHKMKDGMSRKEARRSARLEMGSPDGVREEVHSAGWASVVETFWQDVRFAVRMVRNSPGFTTVAMLTLALGIGANTALFSVVNGVLLNPLPYPRPEELVTVHESKPNFEPAPSLTRISSTGTKDNHTFSSMAVSRLLVRSHRPGGSGAGPGGIRNLRFFPILGVKPVIGRIFVRADDQSGAAPVALISGGFWKRKFGSASDILGKRLALDGRGYTIVGVIPADFGLLSTTSVPVRSISPSFSAPTICSSSRGAGLGFHGIGRIKPGVSIAQVRADLPK